MKENKKNVLKDMLRQGLKIIELYGINNQGYCTCYRGTKCSSTGKHPVHKEWKNSYIRTEKELEDLIDKKPHANFGIITGNGLVVIDVDAKSGGLETLESIKALLPLTLTIKTGGGGYHFYYKTDQHISNRTNMLKGIDIRGDGGFVVAPTSKHKSGEYYTIIEEGE